MRPFIYSVTAIVKNVKYFSALHWRHASLEQGWSIPSLVVAEGTERAPGVVWRGSRPEGSGNRTLDGVLYTLSFQFNRNEGVVSFKKVHGDKAL